jgi:hypothetical protein
MTFSFSEFGLPELAFFSAVFLFAVVIPVLIARRSIKNKRLKKHITALTRKKEASARDIFS